MTEADFRSRFQGTSIMRAKHAGLQKNACVALGNKGDETAVPALVSALETGDHLVRGHAAWALGQIATLEAIKALEQSSTSAPDLYVKSEIDAALLEARQRRLNESASAP
jgi:epoxyqueuosine reductase